MGIGTYNEECRSIVMRYSKEWETIVKRIGRWIDFEVRHYEREGISSIQVAIIFSAPFRSLVFLYLQQHVTFLTSSFFIKYGAE